MRVKQIEMKTYVALIKLFVVKAVMNITTFNNRTKYKLYKTDF